MSRLLLAILLLSAGLSGCNKSNDIVAQTREQAIKDDKIITDYLKSKNLAINQVDTTGVYYIIDTLGTGSDVITLATQVTVGYTARLMTTGEVKSQTDKFHPTFVLGQVMRGWQLGIPKIKKGGVIRLFVPSRDAYGPYAQPQLGLPANAILDFDIKLYDITN